MPAERIKLTVGTRVIAKPRDVRQHQHSLTEIARALAVTR